MFAISQARVLSRFVEWYDVKGTRLAWYGVAFYHVWEGGGVSRTLQHIYPAFKLRSLHLSTGMM